MNVNDIYDRFGIENALENFKPRWNIRPGQLNPVIVNLEKKKIEFMLWGLLPTLPKMSIINTKRLTLKLKQ